MDFWQKTCGAPPQIPKEQVHELTDAEPSAAAAAPQPDPQPASNASAASSAAAAARQEAGAGGAATPIVNEVTPASEGEKDIANLPPASLSVPRPAPVSTHALIGAPALSPDSSVCRNCNQVFDKSMKGHQRIDLKGGVLSILAASATRRT